METNQMVSGRDKIASSPLASNSALVSDVHLFRAATRADQCASSRTLCCREETPVRVRTLFIAVLMAVLSTSALAADPKEIEQKVSELNAQSFKLLGVSLNALRYLVSAEPDGYLLLWHLERTGEINYIRELEAKGYVRTQTVQGLPDGTERKEKFLRVIPMGAGVELQRCVLALQHNSALQPTR